MRAVALAAWAMGAALVACNDGAAGNGNGEQRPIRHPDRMSIWTEERPIPDIEAAVAFVARNKLNLNVSLVRGESDRAYIERVCRAAARRNVALRFWPGLPVEEGYWPNQANVDAFLGWVDELVAMAEEVCPALDGIVVDMEMPWDRGETLREMREDGASMAEIGEWLIDGIDDEAFERARRLYQEAGRRVRTAGLTWTVTTLPMNADDYEDGDETIARALWTPIEGIEWDRVSFQVYRSVFDEHFRLDPDQVYTTGLVTSYARTIVAQWGEKGALDLGITGGGVGVSVPLASAAELQADIAAALAAGVLPGNIAIFSLEGVIGRPDAADWVAMPSPRSVEPAPVDEEIRDLFRQLDDLRTGDP